MSIYKLIESEAKELSTCYEVVYLQPPLPLLKHSSLTKVKQKLSQFIFLIFIGS